MGDSESQAKTYQGKVSISWLESKLGVTRAAIHKRMKKWEADEGKPFPKGDPDKALELLEAQPVAATGRRPHVPVVKKTPTKKAAKKKPTAKRGKKSKLGEWEEFSDSLGMEGQIMRARVMEFVTAKRLREALEAGDIKLAQAYRGTYELQQKLLTQSETNFLKWAKEADRYLDRAATLDQFIGLLARVRQELESLARNVAKTANPSDPHKAEKAIQAGLDNIFSEIGGVEEEAEKVGHESA